MGKAVSNGGIPTAWLAWLAALVFAPLLLAAAGLAWLSPDLERELADRSTLALRHAGVVDAEVAFDGRDATLTRVPRGQEPLALHVVGTLDGVRTARIAPPPLPEGTPKAEVSPVGPGTGVPAPDPTPPSSRPSPPAVTSTPELAVSPAPGRPSPGSTRAPASTPASTPAASPTADRAAVQAAIDTVLAGTAISFEPDSQRLTPQGVEAVARVAQLLRGTPGVRVELGGHVAVAPGGQDNAQRLSLARAIAVRDALVAAGVPADTLVPHGYGDTRPKPDPAASRRVEITVL